MSAATVVVAAQRRFRRRPGSRRRRWILLVVVAVLATVAGGGWIALTSSLFGLHTVTVEGTSRLTAAQVIAAARVRAGESLFRLDPQAIDRRVEELPAVATAEVSRRWPHGLVVRVSERQPAAVVEQAGGAVLLDRTGVAFAVASPSAKTPPGATLTPVTVDAVVGVGGTGTGNVRARAAMQVLGALPPEVRRQVVAVAAPSTLAVTLQLRGGRTVVWGSPTDNATKATVLRALLRRPAHVYDVSTPAVVTTR